ncbi:MAG: hypothetical protein AB1Y25_05890 [Cycloclasticus sp.]
MLKVNKREKWLLAAASVAILVSSYVLFRYQPAQFSLLVIDEQINSLSEQLSKARVPRVASKNTAAIEASIKQQQAMLDKQQMKLDLLEQDLVAQHSPAAVQALMVEISKLAKSSLVLIQETEPFAASQQDRVSKGQYSLMSDLLISGVYKRPAKRLAIEGEFYAIQTFVKGLANLSKKMVVLSLAMTIKDTVAEEDSGQSAQILSAELKVAF